MVARYLEHAQYQVTVVKNYTDVDDKIIARANELRRADRGADGARTSRSYEDDMAKLGVTAAHDGCRGRPSTSPR